jgi:hypothetical protein
MTVLLSIIGFVVFIIGCTQLNCMIERRREDLRRRRQEIELSLSEAVKNP